MANILTYILKFYLTSLTYTLIVAYYLTSLDMLSDIVPGILFDIQCDMLSDMIFGILSGAKFRSVEVQTAGSAGSPPWCLAGPVDSF